MGISYGNNCGHTFRSNCEHDHKLECGYDTRFGYEHGNELRCESVGVCDCELVTCLVVNKVAGFISDNGYSFALNMIAKLGCGHGYKNVCEHSY